AYSPLPDSAVNAAASTADNAIPGTSKAPTPARRLREVDGSAVVAGAAAGTSLGTPRGYAGRSPRSRPVGADGPSTVTGHAVSPTRYHSGPWVGGGSGGEVHGRRCCAAC